MAVTKCVYDRATADCSEDKRGMRTYKLRYRAETDGVNNGPGSVIDGARLITPGAGVNVLPARFATWSFDGDADLLSFAEDFKATRRDKQKIDQWYIDVIWKPLESSESTEDKIEDPLARPVRYMVDWIEETKPVTDGAIVDDLTTVGRPAGSVGSVINACGETPDDVPQYVQRRPVLHAVKNYATLQEIVTLNQTYQNTVNDALFYGAGARMCSFVVAQSGLLITEGAFEYYRADLQFEFNYETFAAVWANTGWKTWDPDLAIGAKLIMVREDMTDLFSELVSNPINLKLDGDPQAANVPQLQLSMNFLPLADYSTIGV